MYFLPAMLYNNIALRRLISLAQLFLYGFFTGLHKGGKRERAWERGWRLLTVSYGVTSRFGDVSGLKFFCFHQFWCFVSFTFKIVNIFGDPGAVGRSKTI